MDDESEENILTYIGDLGDGTYVMQRRDGRLERFESQTDWTRFDSMTDEDIERVSAEDPDWAEFHNIDWSTVEVVRNEPKKPISIRVDPDVLSYFKRGGAGYQKRINAVLLAFVQQKLKARVLRAPVAAKNKPSARKSSRSK